MLVLILIFKGLMIYEVIDICSGSVLKIVKIADKSKQFLLFYSSVVNLKMMDIFPWGNKCQIQN